MNRSQGVRSLERRDKDRGSQGGYHPERDGAWHLSADPTTTNGHPKKVTFAPGLLPGPPCMSLTDGCLWAPAVITGTWPHTMTQCCLCLLGTDSVSP